MKNKTDLKKACLSARGCVGPRIETRAYSVCAPFPIHGKPCTDEHLNFYDQEVKSRF